MPSTVHMPDLQRDIVAAATRMAARPAWRRPRVAGLTAVAAAMFAALVAFFAGAGSDPTATATAIRSGGVVLGDRFAAFRKPAQGNEPDNPFARQHGLVTVDPATARRIYIAGVELWVAADENQVCISASLTVGTPGSAGGACARPAQILDDGLFVSSRPSPADVTAENLPAGTTQVAGLVPDGAEQLTFTLSDGSHHAATIRNGGVVATLPLFPTQMSFRDRDGAVHKARL